MFEVLMMERGHLLLSRNLRVKGIRVTQGEDQE